MGSRFYADRQLGWPIDEKFGFAIGANNLFDKDPPAWFASRGTLCRHSGRPSPSPAEV